MSDAPPSNRCAACGAALQANELGGLCPVCLLAAAARATTPRPGGRPPSHREREPRLVPGQRFGSYRIIRLLGRGGMGEVYEAEHAEHARRVALKILSAGLEGPADRTRFLREGQLAGSVRHPNTVYVFGSEEIDGTPAIAMELLPGGTLQDRLKRDGAMQSVEAVDVILQVIAGLNEAHAAGILHRDVKPGNCFVESDGVVKVGDFGLSISSGFRNVGDSTTIGGFKGTPDFASPEQVRGEPLDVRSDIYAVGATLYSLLTGRPPFEEPSLSELFARIITHPPESPGDTGRDVPRALDAIVLRCLAKDPAERPGTYAELVERLRPFGSQTMAPATLGPRFVAGVVDHIILQLGLALVAVLLSMFVRPNGRVGEVPGFLLFLGVTVAYFAVTEWRTGASPGKHVIGLRVVDSVNTPLTVAAALQRAGLYVGAVRLVAIFVSAAITHMLPARFAPPVPIGEPPLIPRDNGLGMAVMIALLFGRARAGNLYTALHDRWSHTRVVVMRPQPLQAKPRAVVDVVPALADRWVGPYRPLREQPASLPLRTVAGYDEILRRRVWIVCHPPGTPAVSALRQNLRRPSRLRWLAGSRKDEAWDAYEAIEGIPLVATEEARPWTVVRGWLVDLSAELNAGLGDQSLPALGLDRVWITTKGRALLLDWSAAPADAVHAPPATSYPRTDEGAKRFLGALAAYGLGGLATSGPVRAGGSRRRAHEPPPPLSATAFLSSLDAGTAGPPAQWVEMLAALGERPAAVPRLRRAAHLAASSCMPVVIGLSQLSLIVRRGTTDHLDHQVWLALAVQSALFAIIASVGLVSAACARGGLAFRLMDVAVVDRSGLEAGRVRAFARAVVAWAPALALIWLAKTGAGSGSGWEFGLSGRASLTWSMWTPRLLVLALMITGVACAIRRPERGLQDRIAGTWLVPR